MSYEMNDLLNLMVDEGASDLHLQVGQAPTLRVAGGMAPVEGPKLTPEDTEQLMRSIASDHHQQQAKQMGAADFAFAFMDKARFRVSVLKAKGNYGMVLRQIPYKMYSMRELGLPDRIKDLLLRPRGLILVTGPTGSGKSTTLASMINWINENIEGHIITIEDPIEYFHQHKKCIVTQREVGVDVPSFSEAIRGALRQDPDIILVGEMRDLATIEAAVSAAETGHLVFGTLHTTGAARTVDRIVDAFPASTKDQIRNGHDYPGRAFDESLRPRADQRRIRHRKGPVPRRYEKEGAGNHPGQSLIQTFVFKPILSAFTPTLSCSKTIITQLSISSKRAANSPPARSRNCNKLPRTRAKAWLIPFWIRA